MSVFAAGVVIVVLIVSGFICSSMSSVIAVVGVSCTGSSPPNKFRDGSSVGVETGSAEHSATR